MSDPKEKYPGEKQREKYITAKAERQAKLDANRDGATKAAAGLRGSECPSCKSRNTAPTGLATRDGSATASMRCFTCSHHWPVTLEAKPESTRKGK